MEKEEFKNLAQVFNIFTEEYDLSLEQNIASLDLSIEQGYIDKEKLKSELESALKDADFEWVMFAVKNRLIVYDLDKYTNDSIKDYFKSLVWSYLYPKSV